MTNTRGRVFSFQNSKLHMNIAAVCWYTWRMCNDNPKSIRRTLLLALYARYKADPLEMAGPELLIACAGDDRNTLVFNMHYLADRGLVEMMMGYQPPLFSGARITADGIDLVENRFQLDLRFPPAPDDPEAACAELPALMARLAEEVEFCPLDGELRRALLRDVAWLQDEAARSQEKRRLELILSVLDSMAAACGLAENAPPSLEKVRRMLMACSSMPQA